MLVKRIGYDTFGITFDGLEEDVMPCEWVKVAVYIKSSNIEALRTELEAASEEVKSQFSNLLNLIELSLPDPE